MINSNPFSVNRAEYMKNLWKYYVPFKDFQDDIRRKRGKWEIYTDEDGIYGLCSECGIDTDFSHYGEAYAYCPHCGAPMEIEE